MKVVLALIWIGILVCSDALAASRDSAQPIENNWEICTRAVKEAEQAAGIPRHLLSVISQVEAGRWNTQKQVNIAWPWTITAKGTGHFFNSKSEAVAKTKMLLTQGVRNIDVGCMQINLMYHAKAFETLESAFDPATNAQYGANYLKNRYQRTKDWPEAAATYHSTTPSLSQRYKAKVMDLWSQAQQSQPAVPSNPSYTRSNTFSKPYNTQTNVYRTLIEKLNTAFRGRRHSDTFDETSNDSLRTAKHRLKQLDYWRQHRSKGLRLASLAIMRRAELAQRKVKQLNRVSAIERKKSFAKRRRLELAEWSTKQKKTALRVIPTVPSLTPNTQ